jgi:hypothetical protein
VVEAAGFVGPAADRVVGGFEAGAARRLLPSEGAAAVGGAEFAGDHVATPVGARNERI